MKSGIHLRRKHSGTVTEWPPPADSVLIQPMGGLGNQLFIYGAGLALANSHSTELAVDLSWFSLQSKRRYELDSFEHSGIEGSWLNHKARKWPAMFARSKSDFRIESFSEPSFRYWPQFWNVPAGSLIKGYFQSWRYLEPVAGQLRKQLAQPTNPSKWYIDQKESLRRLGPWISCHIRRGDYTVQPYTEVHGVVGIEYYRSAIATARQVAGSMPVLVFSDDIDLAKEVMSSISGEIHFVQPPTSSRSIESLLLMSDAYCAVLANSSFSWWAAWLNDESGKCVIAPSPWFRDLNIDCSDLLPMHWTTIDYL